MALSSEEPDLKTILLTGATGYLGSHLVQALLEEGCRVAILKRLNSDTHRITRLLSDLEVYNVEEGLDKPFRGRRAVNAIIHTATCYGRRGESIFAIFEANTAFPLKLLEAAAFFKIDIFFNTDTMLYKYIDAYSLSKQHFVEWGKIYANLGKIRFVNMRLEHIYGPKDHDSKFTTHVIKSCLANVPELKLTAGEQQRDFIYIDDVVSAYNILLRNAGRQPEMLQEYDVGAGNPVPIREFVKMIHRITHSTTYLNFGALPYRDNEIMRSEPNIAPLKSLGWSCRVELEDGIQRTIQEEACQ